MDASIDAGRLEGGAAAEASSCLVTIYWIGFVIGAPEACGYETSFS